MRRCEGQMQVQFRDKRAWLAKVEAAAVGDDDERRRRRWREGGGRHRRRRWRRRGRFLHRFCGVFMVVSVLF